MRTAKTLLGAAAFSLLLYSCNQADRSQSSAQKNSTGNSSYASADSTVSGAPAPSANASAEESITSPARKIIKTADLRCRVKDVFSATTHIESVVKAAGGIVSDSKMDNEANNTRTLPYTTDSLRQLQSYTTTAHLTLKVPVQRLDTVLTDIAAQSAFINSRHLQLSDVSLQYLGNELKNHAAQGYAAARKANYYNDDRDENLIDRKIENMSLLENVRYATLSVDLYQPERIDAVIIVNTDGMMKPGIGQRAQTALHSGWELVQNFMLLLVYIWPLLLAGIVILFLLKRRKVHRIALTK